jgi:hypothetical protein
MKFGSKYCQEHGYLIKTDVYLFFILPGIPDGHLKPHCIWCSHFKVEDVSALEPSSKPPVLLVRIVDC